MLGGVRGRELIAPSYSIYYQLATVPSHLGSVPAA